MKFNEEKFPALFDNTLVTRKYTHLIDANMMAKIKILIEEANTVRTYLAKSIIEPMLTSYQKLVVHRRELKDSCRCIIYNSLAGNPHVIHYAMLVEEDRINVTGQIHFIVPNSHDFGILFAVCVDRDNGELANFKSYPTVPPLVKIDLHDDVMNVALMAILSAELFINFAEVETKTMTPNSQIWDERGVTAVYNNKTKNNITVIDSTWYTNLVSSGAFKVRGHFRLQPYGAGRSQKRLQWISDFEKSGYTRRAKIENQES